MDQLGDLFYFFKNPEKKAVSEVLARSISGSIDLLIIWMIFSPYNRETFDFLYFPAFWILFIIMCLLGHYVDRQQKHKYFLKGFKEKPYFLVEDNTSISEVCKILDKRPIKEVRDFRLVINSSIAKLIDRFGWEYVSPVYVEINAYCMGRENPNLPITELRERALEEFRHLHKR